MEAETLVIIPMRYVRIMREFNFIYLHNFPMDFIEGFIDFIIGGWG